MSKLPCICGSLVPAAQCCERQAGQTKPPAASLQERRAHRLATTKRYRPKGFPISVAQLRHADPWALSRLIRFLRLSSPPGTFDGLADVLNEGVTARKQSRRVG